MRRYSSLKIKTISGALAVFLERRVAVMVALGFAAGLPNLLIFDTLSLWLRDAGLSLEVIGFFSLATLSYSFKFLWAPLVDRTKIPVLTRLLGHRRSWMLVAQGFIIVGLWLIAGVQPETNLKLMAVFAILVGFSSATQDIVIDAWRIEVAEAERQGVMAAGYQWGYRLAVIVAGAAPLILAEMYSWNFSYASMAALMGIGIAATFAAPREKQHKITPIFTSDVLVHPVKIPGLYVKAAISDPLKDFFHRYGRQASFILALICLYRVSDFVMNIMNPFYLDLGFSKIQIAEVRKIFGVAMSMLGVFAGGFSVVRFGLVRSLLFGAFAGPMSNLAFAWLAIQGAHVPSLFIAIGIDNMASGFAGTCLIAYMSSLTSESFTATQYALFSSLYSLPGKLLASQSGRFVEISAISANAEGLLSKLKILFIKIPPEAFGVAAAKLQVSPAALGVGYLLFFFYSTFIGLAAIILTFILLRQKKLKLFFQ